MKHKITRKEAYEIFKQDTGLAIDVFNEEYDEDVVFFLSTEGVIYTRKMEMVKNEN